MLYFVFVKACIAKRALRVIAINIVTTVQNTI